MNRLSLRRFRTPCLLALIVCLLSLVAAPATQAADDKSVVTLADGAIKLTAPKDWEKREPRTRIVEYEFAAPAVEGDEQEGRITIMGAGGGVEQNIERWIAQFSQPDGKPTSDFTTRKESKIAGQTVHFVDITGTYDDRPGPFAPGVKREKYRMLAAIILTEKMGQYFVKFYGPRRTVAENEEQFESFLNSLKVE